MKTAILAVDPRKPSVKILQAAAEVIRRGGLVAFPTETVYGLGADALNGKACCSIFEAKGRPHDNPLIVHVSEPEEIARFAYTGDQPLLPVLSERFMPGPLTVILPKKEIIPDDVTVGLSTVAIRCPSHPVAHRLIELAGVPIAAPSANRSGRPSPTRAAHVTEDMNGRIDMILDAGEADVGLESTVISLKGDRITLLRPGFITLDDLLSVTPNVEVNPAVLSTLKNGELAESPGMKYRHYAPAAPVTIVRGSNEAVLTFFTERLKGGAAVLCFQEDLARLNDPAWSERVVSFGSENDLQEQAHSLFDALRSFDHRGVSHIYARETASNGLGLALTNRLLRACAFDILSLEDEK